MKLNLQYYSGGHNVTLVKDAGVTTFTASSSSDVQKDAEVTLTVVLATGYHVDKYDVIAGGVTVNPETKKFVMGESDVIIALRTKADTAYIVTEDVTVNINGSKTELKKNVKLLKSPSGAIYGAESGNTALTFDPAVIAQLVANGIIVPA